MAGYIESYGEQEQRRHVVLSRIKRAILAAVTLAIAGGLLWFFFRHFREEAKLKEFVQDLRSKNYPAAYERWGCTQQVPCRDYSYQKFLEDWGPEGAITRNANKRNAPIEIRSTKHCSFGIISEVDVAGDPVLLMVDSTKREVAFAPFATCNPRFAKPSL